MELRHPLCPVYFKKQLKNEIKNPSDSDKFYVLSVMTRDLSVIVLTSNRLLEIRPTTFFQKKSGSVTFDPSQIKIND